MTYPDDVLKAAREAAASYYDGKNVRKPDCGYDKIAEGLRRGEGEWLAEVKIACIAIMAERQRCAGIARAAKGPLEGKDTLFPEEVAQWESCEEIEQAILGQQEGA